MTTPTDPLDKLARRRDHGVSFRGPWQTHRKVSTKPPRTAIESKESVVTAGLTLRPVPRATARLKTRRSEEPADVHGVQTSVVPQDVKGTE
jgi:hypothetical protein